MPYKDPGALAAAQRRWLQARKDVFFADKPCLQCGSREDLQLHHRDPAEKVSHKIWSWAPARFAAEVAKCDVLCDSCHRRHHNALRLAQAEERHPCGTSQAYRRRCRCQPCRDAWAAAARDYKLRRAA